jgi:hypothetical protein
MPFQSSQAPHLHESEKAAPGSGCNHVYRVPRKPPVLLPLPRWHWPPPTAFPCPFQLKMRFAHVKDGIRQAGFAAAHGGASSERLGAWRCSSKGRRLASSGHPGLAAHRLPPFPRLQGSLTSPPMLGFQPPEVPRSAFTRAPCGTPGLCPPLVVSATPSPPPRAQGQIPGSHRKPCTSGPLCVVRIGSSETGSTNSECNFRFVLLKNPRKKGRHEE